MFSNAVINKHWYFKEKKKILGEIPGINCPESPEVNEIKIP